MFLASLFGYSQVYTTRFAAERALATYLWKNVVRDMGFHDPVYSAMSINMMKENYFEALEVWNCYVRYEKRNSSVYVAVISDCKIDQPFE